MALIEPFFESVLGYNRNDLTQGKREYPASLDDKTTDGVDYGLLNSSDPTGLPNLIVECKSPGVRLENYVTQLKRYFIAIGNRYSESPFGVLTNGKRWLFFSDFRRPLIMDDAPFLSFDLLNQPLILPFWLAHWNLKDYDGNRAKGLAWTLRHIRVIKELFIQQIYDPGDSFKDYVHRRLQNHFQKTIDNTELTNCIQKASYEIVGEWYSTKAVREWSDQAVSPMPSKEDKKKPEKEKSGGSKQAQQHTDNLRAPSSVKKIIDYAVWVLHQRGQPLGGRSLGRGVVKAGYRGKSKDPADTVSNVAYAESKKPAPRIVKIGKEYGLPQWEENETWRSQKY